MKKLLTIAVIAFISVLSSQAVAGRERGDNYRGSDFSAIPGLNLTVEQKQKLRAIRDAYLNEVKPLLDQMNNKRNELRSFWLVRTPDRQKIETVQKEVQILRDQLRQKWSAYWIEAQKILTPEQLVKIQSYNPERGYGRRMGYGPSRGYNRGSGS